MLRSLSSTWTVWHVFPTRLTWHESNHARNITESLADLGSFLWTDGPTELANSHSQATSAPQSTKGKGKCGKDGFLKFATRRANGRRRAGGGSGVDAVSLRQYSHFRGEGYSSRCAFIWCEPRSYRSSTSMYCYSGKSKRRLVRAETARWKQARTL